MFCVNNGYCGMWYIYYIEHIIYCIIFYVYINIYVMYHPIYCFKEIIEVNKFHFNVFNQNSKHMTGFY